MNTHHRPLQELAEHGQSAWVDDLTRPMVRQGQLGELIDSGITGVTSNPTTFDEAVTGSDAYDDQLAELAEQHTGSGKQSAKPDPKETFLSLATRDIRDACDLLRPVFDRGGRYCDGWVSLEVDPRLAYDTRATVDEAERLRTMVARPNMFVKIPGTRQGIPAIEEAVSRGIPVNVTLLFSLERHREAARAYLRGLRRRLERGGDLRTLASVASFFVSRVDAEANKRLDRIGGHEELRNTVAVANAKLAYQTYREEFSGPQWEELAEAGARPQQCLWASTSPKDPALRDVTYVEALIGRDTVDTMPRKTIRAFAEHGEVTDTLETDVDEARRTLRRLADAGVDYDDVTAVLEREGVEKFASSFRALFDGITEKQRKLASGRA